MSGKAGTASTISLPKGGGALHGIGETFSPDLHTGTGNFTVPIEVLPGRNRFQPQLNLAYSTGNGNGPFGLGWSLSVPGVARKTSEGVPIYDIKKDSFILSGAEDLVPLPGGPSKATRYRPRTEGLFARIDHFRDPTSGHDFWEARSKDGLVSLYGTPGGAGKDPAALANPADRSRVFAWKLSRTTDTFGNRIDYAYERDAVQADGPHHWDQLYLSDIRYADYGVPTNPQFLVTVNFIYEQRPDPFSEYRAGFEIRTVKRCARIEIRTHAGQERLVRTYNLVYLDERNDRKHALPPNGVSLLSRIEVVGHDGSKAESLPPLEFGYTRFEPSRRDFFPITGPDMPRNSLAHADYELSDLTGDGLPDILEMNGVVRYWRNRGGGRFDLPREMSAAPSGVGLADKGVQLIDANGDGRVDLLVANTTLAGYYPMRFGGLWDKRSFQPYRTAPSFDLKDPEVRLVDMDGDGVTDAVRSGTRLECYFNDPKEGWNKTRFVERRALSEFPNINFSDPRVKWADMTGDGLQDIVLVHNGSVEYWPNLGHGNWDKQVYMCNNPRFPYGYDPKRILVGDVDGDGLADIVYIDDAKVTLWINRSGNGWGEPIVIKGTPPVSDIDAIRLADMLGSGVSGVLWSAEAGRPSRERIFFLDFTGGTKPYLLNKMDNHMGAVTHVEYAPSTRFYLEDQKKPQTRWKTPLPFPVQVVAGVEVIDCISGGKLTTEYRYHHGYWDGAEREFRGFGMVEHLDTQVFHLYNRLDPDEVRSVFKEAERVHFSPPTLTKTWFHLGPVGDEFGEWEEVDYSCEFWGGDPQVLDRPKSMADFLKGLPRRAKRDAFRALRSSILRTELYALDGSERQDRPYTVTEKLWGVAPLPVGKSLPDEPEGWQLKVFFPHALAERTTQWERSNDPMTQIKFTGNYDEYGQARSQVSIAVPRGRRYREASAPGQSVEEYLAVHTVTGYAKRDDDERFIIDRVASTTTYEIENDGSPSLFALKEDIENTAANSQIVLDRKVIGHSLNFYDGEAFKGLAYGKIGDYGALTRTETQVVTEDVLGEAYPSGDPLLTAGTEPLYLAHGGSPAWPGEYPKAFTELHPTDNHDDPTRPGLAITPTGYGFAAGGTSSSYASGYYAATERRRYDFQNDPQGKGRGLVKAKRDPLGHEVAIEYDQPYDLLAAEVKDAAGLVTKAGHDYRVFQPDEATDPNENKTLYTYTPLGLPESIAIVDKDGKGDSPAEPSSAYTYDFLAFASRKEPVWVSAVRRSHHAGEIDIPQPEKGETIKTVEYSDGFGRLIQTRTQAEDVVFGIPDSGGAVDETFGDRVLGIGWSDPGGMIDGGSVADPVNKPRVVVSGWQIYDNKGQVVKKHEPFYSEGWEFDPPTDAQLGQDVTIYYDPRGHAIRTVNPDDSEQRVVYGVPGSIGNPDLSDPDIFEPTPWEAYTYDVEDNAGRTHPGRSTGYQHCWNTPASIEVDALGRTVVTIERNRRKLTDGSWSAVEEYATRSTYDIRGNLLTVTDALNRKSFRYHYDLANQPLRIESIDAGIRRIVLDAAGGEVERRDSKGSLVLHAFDLLHRPIRLWARDDRRSQVTLRECLEYGDGGDPKQPTGERDTGRSANRLGKIYKHYDEAGLLTFETYDFKGNVLEKARRVITDDQILTVFVPAATDGWRVGAYRVDWQPPSGKSLSDHAENLLDAVEYQTSITYDALNRVKTMVFPEDVRSERKVLRPHYNRAGALESVELEDRTYVDQIAYNAKGQRTLIAYGNGVMTRYAYDPKTFRLARMRTERYTKSVGAGVSYRSNAATDPLQDIAYTYDLAGNILNIDDRTPGCGVLNNPEALLYNNTDQVLASLLTAGNALIRRFDYDPLYRLISATGRESAGMTRPRPWPDEPRYGTPNQDNAPNSSAVYREEYAYDPAGNMISLAHRDNGNSWTRRFGMGGLTPQQWGLDWLNHFSSVGEWTSPPGNRLTHVGDDNSTVRQTHHFDENGNLVRENTERHFEWDFSDRMRIYRNQSKAAGALPEEDRRAEPSTHAHYLYDAGGQRVKKLVRNQGGGFRVTVYIDGLFEHHLWTENGGRKQNNHLHVLDDQKRIALVRIGDPHPDDKGKAIQYHLGDHLGSSSVVVDQDGTWINREEYYPYGETSFGSFAKKRYRFTGKERDEESGLYPYETRYYAPWLLRWISPDSSFIAIGQHCSYTRNAGKMYGRLSLEQQWYSLYVFVMCSPLVFVDEDGRDSKSFLSALASKTRLWTLMKVLQNAIGVSDPMDAIKPSSGETGGEKRTQDAKKGKLELQKSEGPGGSGSNPPAGKEGKPTAVKAERAPTPKAPKEIVKESQNVVRRPFIKAGGVRGSYPERGFISQEALGIRGQGLSFVYTYLAESLVDFVKAGLSIDLESRWEKSEVFGFSKEQLQELLALRQEQRTQELLEQQANKEGIPVDQLIRKREETMKQQEQAPYPMLIQGSPSHQF